MDSGSNSKMRHSKAGALILRLERENFLASQRRFGSWEILSPTIRAARGQHFVQARCKCGRVKDVVVQMLLQGRTTQCKGCATRQRHARDGHALIQTAADLRLQKRVTAMRQRCTNPNDQSWHNYGGRGIEFRFRSVKHAIDYIKRTLPHPTYLGLDIDRRNNDGHYAPGNLRLATRRQNLANRRLSKSTTS